MNWFKQLWAEHGTKVLGYGSILIGALAEIDERTAQLIASLFGHAKETMVLHLLLAFGGVMTAMRGYKNSQPK